MRTTAEGAWRDQLSDPCRVPVETVLASDSPRLAGVDDEHARVLAESGAVLPPIVIHRATRRVVDGMHRLQAAVLRGEDTIEARYFDGSDRDAFVLAVELNTAHGLPLCSADRAAAAERILESHPEWSDRAVSAVAGLSAKAVGAIRRKVLVEGHDVPARIGRDGRTRPLNSAAGRRRASELIAADPRASLRKIADQAGLSPGTVRDVRERMRRGEDPVPSALRTGRPAVGDADGHHRPQPFQLPSRSSGRDAAVMLEALVNDPSLRLTENGRHLLRLLSTHAISRERRARIIESVPPHAVATVSEVARECASAWEDIARQLTTPQRLGGVHRETER
ncbi:ParB N-terminal domain-containing protein [Streptomyces sp. AcE210]|uniref:ParB/RepB/Spo0J family partition protein n=1 Tax=Streptomyces sp. AcE210 TaxID=2292703 RepID=UPI000E3035C8|nr:ParB N-terminal domain-containing protein [Streptomyces sp. AcE210]RFC71510.1 streptomycin biosynthesis regulator [Streptomyces sp. AcE210]